MLLDITHTAVGPYHGPNTQEAKGLAVGAERGPAAPRSPNAGQHAARAVHWRAGGEDTHLRRGPQTPARKLAVTFTI